MVLTSPADRDAEGPEARPRKPGPCRVGRRRPFAPRKQRRQPAKEPGPMTGARRRSLRREPKRRSRRQEPKEGSCHGSESRLLGCLGPELSSTVAAVVTPQRAGGTEDGLRRRSTGKAGITIEHGPKIASLRARRNVAASRLRVGITERPAEVGAVRSAISSDSAAGARGRHRTVRSPPSVRRSISRWISRSEIGLRK